MKVCPKCGREFDRLLAVSRVDNSTMICDTCGNMEALEDICGFCTYYQCAKEDIGEREECSVEIGIKVCTCRKRKGKNKSSSLLSRMFRLEYCPVCGKKLGG